MTTKQIEYVLNLSHTLNFNKTAENFYISQPTLSYQIKELEKEIGFDIFVREGKNVSLTPAGSQFCRSLGSIQLEIKNAIEQGQNYGAMYDSNIKIYVSTRSAMPNLPDAIKKLAELYPGTSVSPYFYSPDNNYLEDFLKGDIDIYLGMGQQLEHVGGLKKYDFYTAGFMVITLPSDPLAKLKMITEDDLSGRTLMVGGGSPPPLIAIQKRLISKGGIKYFNSANHDTTLTNVAAGNGICIAPGTLVDNNPDFAWTPFVCEENIPYYLYIHANENRKNVKAFLKILLKDSAKLFHAYNSAINQ